MKVLFISAVCPLPQHSGGQIRIYQLLKKLGKKHHISLVCYIRSESERQYEKELRRYCQEVHFLYRGKVWHPVYLLRAAISTRSLLATSYDNEEVKSFINARQHEFDLVHIEPYYVYPAVTKDVKRFSVGEHNIEYQVYADFVKQSNFFPLIKKLMIFDVKKMEKEEESVWHRAKAISAVSKEDAQIIQQVAPKDSVTVVSNGVDTQFYTFNPRPIDTKNLHFLYVGNFSWTPNMQAIEKLLKDIWPNVITNYPQARLTVIGKKLSKQLINPLPSQVAYHESVSDIRQYYHQCSALLAPTSVAGGTKYKILESFASGLPVVTTKEGIHGLSAKDKEHVLVVTEYFDYIQAIKWLVNQTKHLEAMTQKARQLVENDYDWDTIAIQQEQCWKRALC